MSLSEKKGSTVKNQEAITMLDKLRANPELKGDALALLREMVWTLDDQRVKDPNETEEQQKQSEAQMHLTFDTRLATVANLFLALSVVDGATRIAHWCTQEKEKDVKGLASYPIYWLELADADCVLGDDPIHHLYLSIWAAGSDMNEEEKAIKLWAKEHFSGYRVESLRQVRRGKFTA